MTTLMEQKKEFKIAVLEDSEFYNSILTKQLEHYTSTITIEKGYKFYIQSYISSDDCLRNIKPDIDIVFLDYYLGNGVTASEVLKKIKQKCKDCKIIIISQEKTIKTAMRTISDGAIEFIYKDVYALPKSCFIVEDIINGKYA